MKPVEIKQFIRLDELQKESLLRCLGYNVDLDGYVTQNSEKVICRYSKLPVLLKDASILPGSTIIINTSMINLSEYVSEFLEIE